MVCEGVPSILLPEVGDQEVDLAWLIDAGDGIVRPLLSLQVQLNVLSDGQA